MPLESAATQQEASNLPSAEQDIKVHACMHATAAPFFN